MKVCICRRHQCVNVITLILSYIFGDCHFQLYHLSFYQSKQARSHSQLVIKTVLNFICVPIFVLSMNL